MFLPARLRTTTLGDLLGALHRARVSGDLELIGRDLPHPGWRHRISVRDGLVSDVRTPLPVPPLGEMLVQQGDLTRAQQEQLLALLPRRPGTLAGEVIVGLGLATRERVVGALSRQNRLRLDALFELHDADVRFHPLKPPSRSEARLGPAEFLYGRRRAREGYGEPVPKHADEPLSQAFQVLGLTPAAPRRDVRRAFRRLASSIHPDLHPHVSAAQRRDLETRFTELSQAYHAIVTRTASRSVAA